MLPIRDTVPSYRFPLANILIIGGCIAAFIHEASLPANMIEPFIYTYGVVPSQMMSTHKQSLSAFVTTMFLHGGLLHLVSNMWALWIFGDNVEDRMGKFRYLLFYLVCGVVASAIHILSAPTSKLPIVGASGAIAGVMGAYFMMYPRSRIVVMFPIIFYPVFFQVPAVLYLGLWFYSQVSEGIVSASMRAQIGGVAWWAHVGGFVSGAVIYKWFERR